MKITSLQECPEYIDTLATWFANGFGHEGACFDEERAWLIESLKTSARIPITFVAFDGESPVGTARIFENEMPDRPQFNPWFGYAYVVPHYRKRGVARALYERCVSYCIEQGLQRAYLYTWEMEQPLARRGWQVRERRQWLGSEVVVMAYELVKQANERHETP